MPDQPASHDPKIVRNKVYDEMRSIAGACGSMASACEKLAHRANLAAAKLIEEPQPHRDEPAPTEGA